MYWILGNLEVFLTIEITESGESWKKEQKINLDRPFKGSISTLSFVCGYQKTHGYIQSLRLAPKNWRFWTVVLEKPLENPLHCKEIQLVHPKGNQSWTLIGRTDAEVETPILWPPDGKNWLTGKDLDDQLERLKEGGEGDDSRWDGWMASPSPWTWVWVGSGSWWWTGKPGVLQYMGSQRVAHNWATELNWSEYIWLHPIIRLGKGLTLWYYSGHLSGF